MTVKNDLSLLNLVALKRAGWVNVDRLSGVSLTSESVEGASLPLESIDNIHGGDSLPLGMFGVGDGIPDDVLKENLEDSTGLLIDKSRDTLDPSTASQPSDGGLGDSLDVVSQHLTVTLGASLSKSFSSFATSGHVAGLSVTDGLTSMRCRIYAPLPPMTAKHHLVRSEVR